MGLQPLALVVRTVIPFNDRISAAKVQDLKWFAFHWPPGQVTLVRISPLDKVGNIELKRRSVSGIDDATKSVPIKEEA